MIIEPVTSVTAVRVELSNAEARDLVDCLAVCINATTKVTRKAIAVMLRDHVLAALGER